MKQIMLVLLLAVFIVGCDDDNSDDDINSNSDLNVFIDTFDKFNQQTQTFTQGEDIAIKLSLENKTTNEITIAFSTSQQFNIQAKDINENIVWNWTTGKEFDPASSTITIPAGETHVEIIYWNQTISSNDTYLEIGDYRLEGYYLTTGIVDKIDISVR